jgi:phage terminase small subunit
MAKSKLPPEPRFPDPPAHLSDSAKRLWVELGPASADTLGRRALFQAGLEALDRCEAARLLIGSTGMTEAIGGRIAHAHPAVKIESESRKQFMDIWRTLGLASKAERTYW